MFSVTFNEFSITASSDTRLCDILIMVVRNCGYSTEVTLWSNVNCSLLLNVDCESRPFYWQLSFFQKPVSEHDELTSEFHSSIWEFTFGGAHG